ncbi:MAG: hypothetical protein E7267_02085 [Lachnospiraceae bacterium]|nr:hypothetical protein [Lachnospiraceae bacterium]
MKFVTICEYYELHRPGYKDVFIILKAIMKRLGSQKTSNTILLPEYIFYNEKMQVVKFSVADKYNVSEQEGVRVIFKYMKGTSVYSGENVRKLIEEVECMYRDCGPNKTYEQLEKEDRKRKRSFVFSVVFIIVVTGMLVLYYSKIQPFVFYN